MEKQEVRHFRKYLLRLSKSAQGDPLVSSSMIPAVNSPDTGKCLL